MWDPCSCGGLSGGSICKKTKLAKYIFKVHTTWRSAICPIFSKKIGDRTVDIVKFGSAEVENGKL
jgi:hypothetical protein